MEAIDAQPEVALELFGDCVQPTVAEMRRARRRKGSVSPTCVLSPAESEAGSGAGSGAGSEVAAEDGIEDEVAALATSSAAEAALIVEAAVREAVAAKEAVRAAKRAEIEAKVIVAKLLQAVQAAEGAIAAAPSAKAARAAKAADLLGDAPKSEKKVNCSQAPTDYGPKVKETRMQEDFGAKKFIKP